MTAPGEERLRAAIGRHGPLIIAVSGGVDSMTLAYLAHRWNRETTMFHAVSPAVPAAATERVRRHAGRHGWRLKVAEAGEFDDPRYRANPVDRCYFCKTNLYARITFMTSGTVASGANTDDLSDYRPGLHAAREHRIVHPFIEAGYGKEMIRNIARRHDLDDLAELPAQPCLASRIETGIRISPEDMAFVEEMELALSQTVPSSANLRCRVTHDGIVVEVDPAFADEPALRTLSAEICGMRGRRLRDVRAYRKGSAFLHKPVAR